MGPKTIQVSMTRDEAERAVAEIEAQLAELEKEPPSTACGGAAMFGQFVQLQVRRRQLLDALNGQGSD